MLYIYINCHFRIHRIKGEQKKQSFEPKWECQLTLLLICQLDKIVHKLNIVKKKYKTSISLCFYIYSIIFIISSGVDNIFTCLFIDFQLINPIILFTDFQCRIDPSTALF